MGRKNAAVIYLLGTFIQMIIACMVVLLFENNIPLIKDLAIIVGGVSSALWGIIVSNKYKGISIKQVLFDFINIKKSYRYYLLIFMYLLLDFCYVIIGGNFEIKDWYIPIIFF